jgi:hypothetical protein
LLLLCCLLLLVSLLLSFSLLAVSCADFNISFLISFDHLVQLLKWLALFMQSPLLQFLSANGQITMISHAIFFILCGTKLPLCCRFPFSYFITELLLSFPL